MKDTKIAQLLINKLSRKKYRSITPNENQFYITDEQYTDVPLGFGIYSEVEVGDNWAKVTDEYVNASDYPEIWEAINGILDGDISVSDMKVCTVSQSQEMINTNLAWANKKGKQKIAEYYIIDKVNNKFKFPRYIAESRMIGDPDASVISSTSNYDGTYMISSQGKYFEYGAVMRLTKDTKTVDGKSYVYYKPSQIPNRADIIPTENIVDGHTKYLVHTPMIATISKEMINEKYDCNYFVCKDYGKDASTHLSRYKIEKGYPMQPLSKELTTNSFTMCLPLYDESIENGDVLITAIPVGENESVIGYTIEGFVEPPVVEDYNLGTNLYIKVS